MPPRRKPLCSSVLWAVCAANAMVVLTLVAQYSSTTISPPLAVVARPRPKQAPPRTLDQPARVSTLRLQAPDAQPSNNLSTHTAVSYTHLTLPTILLV